MALSHSEAQVLYARYLKSGMTLEKFCKLHQVPYWDFLTGLTNGKIIWSKVR